MRIYAEIEGSGSRPVMEHAAEFFMVDMPKSFGTAIKEVDLKANLPTKKRGPTLPEYKKWFQEYVKTLPQVKFMRSKRSVEIKYYSEMGYDSEVSWSAARFDHFLIACRELVAALDLIRERLKKGDSFDWDALAAHLQQRLAQLPKKESEFKALAKMLDARAEAWRNALQVENSAQPLPAKRPQLYFRDLQIDAADDLKGLKGNRRKELQDSMAAIQEIFLRLMPRKYRLDGTAKTNLVLDSTGAPPLYENQIDVNTYTIGDFDFRACVAGSQQERDGMVLDALERCMLDLASRGQADPAPIRTVIAEMRTGGCERRFEYKSLSRMTPSRKLKLNVFRHIYHGGEDWSIDITNRKGEVLATERIAKKVNAWCSTYDYRRSVVTSKYFMIYGYRGGRATYRLNVAALEKKVGS